MGCKLFVALQLEVAHHFVERLAGGRTSGFEPPATFRATKTPKTHFINPYQLPAHGRLCRGACLHYLEFHWYLHLPQDVRVRLKECRQGANVGRRAAIPLIALCLAS